jgi:phospholipid/cholesterol/gamma-HCH transport system ATP-binding protein
MTIFQNVAFPLKEKTRIREKEIREKVMYELEQVGLIGSEDKYPSQISGGMLKRASIARALIEEPEFMLIDEPTTGLDPVTGQTILNLIDSCHQRFRFTGIIVTHEIPKIFEIVDKVAMLHEGVILFFGTPQEIMKAQEPVVKTFVTGSMEWLRDLECGPDPVIRIPSRRKSHTI